MFPRVSSQPLQSLGLSQFSMNPSLGMPLSMMQMPDLLPRTVQGPNSVPISLQGAGSLGMLSRGAPLLPTGGPLHHQVPATPLARNNKIWIKHLPASATIVQLGVYFSSFGKVIDCEVIKDQLGRSTGVGYVCYESEETAQREVNKQHTFQGQKLVLQLASSFEAQPDFNEIVTGKVAHLPPGKSSFVQEDDFEMQMADHKGRHQHPRPVEDRSQGGGRQINDPSPQAFGDPRQLHQSTVLDSGTRPNMPSMLGLQGAPPPHPPQQPALPPDPRAQGPGGMFMREPSPRRDSGFRVHGRDSRTGPMHDLGGPMATDPRGLPGAGMAPVPPVMLAPPVRLEPVPPPVMHSVGVVPVRAQAVSSSSALYGPSVVVKPGPEFVLQGDNLKSVYVSGLAWWTTEDEVRRMVVEILGTGVPFNVVFDEHKPNGKSLGSVFIDVQTEQIAQLIIKGLTGRVINRRELKAELFSSPAEGADPGAHQKVSSGPGGASTALSDRRKPEPPDPEPPKKRPRPEATEICKWHLEGGCRYESACPLLHPDLQRKGADAKDKVSRVERRSKDDDKERRRAHKNQREEKKEKTSRKEAERPSKATTTRHRHRPEESEENSESEVTEVKTRRRK